MKKDRIPYLLICFYFLSNSLMAQYDRLELFHENGHPKSIEYFDENGKYVKEATYYHNNEQLHYVQRYKEGYRIGKVVKYRKNGVVSEITKYSQQGKYRLVTKFDRDGVKVSVVPYMSYKKEGKFRYYRKGKISQRGNYENGKRQGKQRFYAGNGRKVKVEFYENGQLHGPSIAYYPSGKLKYKKTYQKGAEIGISKYYYENGIVKYIYEFGEPGKYRRTRMLNVLEVNDVKGNPLDKGTLKDGNGTYYQYNNQGKSQRSYYLENGLRSYKKNRKKKS